MNGVSENRDEAETRHHNLLFDVERSMRYHDRRAGYFELLHKFTSLLTILTAGLALVDLSGVSVPRWLVFVVAITAVAAASDLVIGFGKMADLHRGLRRRYLPLQISLSSAVISQAELQAIVVERLTIEVDEPPVYRALDVLCHNELMLAKGYTVEQDEKEFGYLPFYKRLTAHIARWPNQASVPKPRLPSTKS